MTKLNALTMLGLASYYTIYEASTPDIQEAVDDATQEAINALQGYWLPCVDGSAKQDLTAAIMKYVIASKNEKERAYKDDKADLLHQLRIKGAL